MRAAMINAIAVVWRDWPWFRPYMVGAALLGIVWAWFVVAGLRALAVVYGG